MVSVASTVLPAKATKVAEPAGKSVPSRVMKMPVLKHSMLLRPKGVGAVATELLANGGSVGVVAEAGPARAKPVAASSPRKLMTARSRRNIERDIASSSLLGNLPGRGVNPPVEDTSAPGSISI